MTYTSRSKATLRPGAPADPLAWAEAGRCGPDVRTCRRVVHASRELLIEDSARDVANPVGGGHSPLHQVVFPYFGAFDWHVGRTHRLIDVNSVLFVTGDQEFVESHPHRRVGHASVIVTPSAQTLEETQLGPGAGTFAQISRPTTDSIRVAVHRLLAPELQDLEREELVAELLAALAERSRRSPGVDRPVVQRAKQVLHEHGFEPLSLGSVAKRVGVSPIYLTQAFTRSEGMPLYRYQMRLRLNRALYELPRCDSLVQLALDLGFSSHSHFTSTFRAVFGKTPSEFRSSHCSGAVFGAAA